MLAVHTARRTWRSFVDLYLALTPFVRAKFIEGGLPRDRILVKPNFVDPDPGIGAGSGTGALYVGRLAEEKGIATLLEAWRYVNPAIPLRVIGNGPLLATVTEASRAQPNIEVLGWRPYDEVLTAMKTASVLIVPSVWYETFGLVVIQAMAVGLPVVASGFGAMADLIEHGRTGLHFRPGDSADLARQALWLMDHPDEAARLRAAARSEYEAKYTADRNYEGLMRAYAEAGARARGNLTALIPGPEPGRP